MLWWILEEVKSSFGNYPSRQIFSRNKASWSTGWGGQKLLQLPEMLQQTPVKPPAWLLKVLWRRRCRCVKNISRRCLHSVWKILSWFVWSVSCMVLTKVMIPWIWMKRNPGIYTFLFDTNEMWHSCTSYQFDSLRVPCFMFVLYLFSWYRDTWKKIQEENLKSSVKLMEDASELKRQELKECFLRLNNDIKAELDGVEAISFTELVW